LIQRDIYLKLDSTRWAGLTRLICLLAFASLQTKNAIQTFVGVLL
jgi:hypothetical protein